MDQPTPPRIALVACCKSKLDWAASARELYTGALFRKSRAYAEATCQGWFILSAEHHLLAPSQIVSPYNTTLKGASLDTIRNWGKIVSAEISARVPAGAALVVLAGRDYLKGLDVALWDRYGREEPLAGCRGNGEQMQRLDRLVGARGR